MPEDLQKHIDSFDLKFRNMNPKPTKDQTWVSCEGENPADKEALGKVRYFPKTQGFSSEYFPYMGHDSYQSPLVAVQFVRPKVGQLLHVECRAWAKNIEHDTMKRIGMVHFELFILDQNNFELYKNNELP